MLRIDIIECPDNDADGDAEPHFYSAISAASVMLEIK